MQFEKYVSRMQCLQELIERQNTGTPKELADKMGISERMLYRYIKALRCGEKRIEFSRTKRSYIFHLLSDQSADKIHIEYVYIKSYASAT